MTKAINVESAVCDAQGSFPEAAFEALEAAGLIAQPPVKTEATPELLRLLAAVGRGDMSTGRLYEGHVNAVILARQFSRGAALERAERLLAAGGTFGVWNTDAPQEPLVIENGVLSGKKNFASGVDRLSHAIVTTGSMAERMMWLVPIENLSIDRSWWKPMGMRSSGSHVVDFSGVVLEDDWAIGFPGDYTSEPLISAGAIRFVAVQVGGMHAILDVTLDHLRRLSRCEDRLQQQRLAKMAIAVETGYLWLDRVGREWRQPKLAKTVIPSTAAARGVVENAAMLVLDLAEKSVGAAGMIAPHPLERLVRDLRTYLRQPNPDGAADVLGKSVADLEWAPGLGRATP
ncbi:acyl-CoA dehydrogenase family protein [Pararhizobium haloflavum]|uniref:acyl-CoA dehydrogenase family protein n=1 Tax=Pararhizobium haloflavum TaxID=2037914 RepID=UPI0012FFEA55|nr:acyl-CoA dehydrogenase family protein [Pararhizobium haloflavum]